MSQPWDHLHELTSGQTVAEAVLTLTDCPRLGIAHDDERLPFTQELRVPAVQPLSSHHSTTNSSNIQTTIVGSCGPTRAFSTGSSKPNSHPQILVVPQATPEKVFAKMSFIPPVQTFLSPMHIGGWRSLWRRFLGWRTLWFVRVRV